MNKILVVLATLSLVGCGWVDRVTATATGYSTVCVEGVKYIQFTSGASVAYSKDGKVQVCN